MVFKKPKHNLEEDSSGDWMLTYSDMVTLLFTFFVVLFSISSPDLMKLELISKYFSKTKKMTYAELQQKIEEFIVSNNVEEEVEVSLTSKGIEISFKDKLLFDSGKAALKQKAYTILGKIAELLEYQELADRKISVEGHTDSIPIRSDQFPSNWELSSARASSVVKFFIGQGLYPQRFESIGYADTRPLVPENSYGGEPKNRRVVVVISPQSYLSDFSRKEIDLDSVRGEMGRLGISSEGVTAKHSVAPEEKNKPADTVTPPNTGRKTPEQIKMGQFFMAGQKEFKSGNYEKAIEYWRKVLEIDPGHQLSMKNIERARSRLK